MQRIGLMVLNAVLWTAAGAAGAWVLAPGVDARMTPAQEYGQLRTALEPIGLEQEQEEQIEGIVKRFQESVVETFEEFKRRRIDLEQAADAQIQAVLTPQQRERFNATATELGSQAR